MIILGTVSKVAWVRLKITHTKMWYIRGSYSRGVLSKDVYLWEKIDSALRGLLRKM